MMEMTTASNPGAGNGTPSPLEGETSLLDRVVDLYAYIVNSTLSEYISSEKNTARLLDLDDRYTLKCKIIEDPISLISSCVFKLIDHQEGLTYELMELVLQTDGPKDHLTVLYHPDAPWSTGSDFGVREFEDPEKNLQFLDLLDVLMSCGEVISCVLLGVWPTGDGILSPFCDTNVARFSLTVIPCAEENPDGEEE